MAKRKRKHKCSENLEGLIIGLIPAVFAKLSVEKAAEKDITGELGKVANSDDPNLEVYVGVVGALDGKEVQVARELFEYGKNYTEIRENLATCVISCGKCEERYHRLLPHLVKESYFDSVETADSMLLRLI